jgi:hypothetical protein
MPGVSSMNTGACDRMPGRAREAREVVVAEAPLAERLRVDARLAREHALDERVLAHLEREEGDALLLGDRHVLRDVERERRLAHRRASRDDHQVRRLEPARHLVEVAEPRRDPGHRAPGLALRLDALHRRPEELLDAREARAALRLADLEDLPLGLVEQLARELAALERVGDHRRRHLDEAAQTAFSRTIFAWYSTLAAVGTASMR